MIKLRDYQIEAITSIYNYFDFNSGNPVLALPTGTGKTPIIAGFVKSVFDKWPNQRFMITSHVKELLEQNYNTLKRIWPNSPAGIYSAGLNQKDIAQPIIFGGIASIVNCAEAFGHRDLFIIDECHLLSPNDDTMYQSVIKRLKVINPNLKVIGLSATPYRLGQGMITDDGLFTDICFDVTGMEAFNRFIYEGYLVPLIPSKTDIEYDVSNLKLVNGDFAKGELQQEVDKKEITYKILQEAIPKCLDRKCWLVFASGVEHAEHTAEMLNMFGIPSATVHSKISKDERANRIADFKAGKIRCLVNNNVLTTGFDWPKIDCILMLRPTMSPGLFVQMLGRGTRPDYAAGFDLSTINGRLAAIAASDKQNCLVLDFAGNTRRLGPINDPIKPKSKKKKVCDFCKKENDRTAKVCVYCGNDLAIGDAPIKICPQCNTYNHASARHCILCGTEFKIANKLETFASTAALIKEVEIPIIEDYTVDRVIYQKHKSRKPDKPDSLQVTYFSGLLHFNEWVCLEHSRNHLAREWWRNRYNLTDEIPETIDRALEIINSCHFRTPDKIKVWVNKKFPQILNHEF